MWVRTQDKKSLLKVSSFTIERNFGGKKKKAIMGVYGSLNLAVSNSKMLGLYNTDDDALIEMNTIEANLIENTQLVYQMN